MRISKGLVSLAAVGAVSLLAITACTKAAPTPTTPSSLADCAANPVTCNSGATKAGGTVVYTIEKKITGWNLNDADSNTFDFAEVLDGVLPTGPFTVPPDFNPILNTDFASAVDVTSQSPQTIVYKVKPEAVWNDGTPINVDDFVYNWKSNDGVVADCKDCSPASAAGYDSIKSITGADNGKTVTVVFDKPFSDWKALFTGMYPAHVAKTYGDLTTSDGLSKAWKAFNDADNYPKFSGGPYIISSYDKDVSVTLTPNPKWYGKTKPSLDKLVFRIIEDQKQEVPALQNGEVNAIYPQPNQDIVSGVKNLADVNYVLGKGLIWEHLDLQTQNEFLKDKALRSAIFTTVSRKDVISKTVGQFAPGVEPLNSHNFVPGQAGYKDMVSASGQGSGNLDAAKKILTDAGYTGVGTALKTKDGKDVTLRIGYTNGNVLRQQTCELIQNELAGLGIKVTVTPFASLGKTLASGNYDLIIFAWVSTPFPYSGAIQIWGGSSDSNYNHFTSSASDDLLSKAAQETDPTKANDELNQSDALLTADAVVLPLFQKPTFLAAYSNIANIRDNASSVGPPYNVEAWGLRAA